MKLAVTKDGCVFRITVDGAVLKPSWAYDDTSTLRSVAERVYDGSPSIGTDDEGFYFVRRQDANKALQIARMV
jgi:hypothetical protein